MAGRITLLCGGVFLRAAVCGLLLLLRLLRLLLCLIGLGYFLGVCCLCHLHGLQG